ncbi:lipid A export permease/ATP-binding protein MsbA [Pseudomonadota bacterium]
MQHTNPVEQQPYRRLLSKVRPYWKTFALGILATVIVGASEAAIPSILGPLIDGSFVDKDSGAALHFSLMLVALFLVRGLSQYTSAVAMGWIGHKVIMDLRGSMFHNLINAPSQAYDLRPSGSLLSKLTYDVNQVAEATTNVVVIIVRDTVTIIGLLAFMFYTDWQLALLFFATLPIIGLIVKSISKRLRRLNLSLMGSVGEMNTIAEEAINGHKEVKLFGAQAYENTRFNHSINWVRRYYMKTLTTSAASVPVVQLLAVVTLAIVVNMAAAQEPAMSAGTFAAFFTAMGQLLAPIKRLTSVNEALQRGLAAAQTVFAVIDEPNEPDSGKKALQNVKGKVELKQVAFKYPEAEQAALTDISLTIQPGETVALVGQSGSGKSTLASLIPRFYQPTSGVISIEDTDIQHATLTSLRANLSLVSQQVILFNDTIAANIAYGSEHDISEHEIIQAAEKAHAMEFINKLPEGLQTPCGHNGSRLSGGQRQRIAIARALLKNAPILILDEATSALDTESEQKVQEALDKLMEGRTTITIAHRLSTIKKADRIVVLDQGKIAEIGSHDELLEKSGRYANLYKIQFSSQENLT